MVVVVDCDGAAVVVFVGIGDSSEPPHKGGSAEEDDDDLFLLMDTILLRSNLAFPRETVSIQTAIVSLAIMSYAVVAASLLLSGW